jgi:hypothetical protein
MQVANACRWLMTFERFGFQSSIHRYSVSPWHLFDMFVYGGMVMWVCQLSPDSVDIFLSHDWPAGVAHFGNLNVSHWTIPALVLALPFNSLRIKHIAIQFVHSFIRSFIQYFKLNFCAFLKSNVATASEEVVSSGRDSQ